MASEPEEPSAADARTADLLDQLAEIEGHLDPGPNREGQRWADLVAVLLIALLAVFLNWDLRYPALLLGLLLIGRGVSWLVPYLRGRSLRAARDRLLGDDDARATPWVRVVPYDARWPEVFAEERERLASVLGPGATAIHHMGSTSVPGLCAKPVIDVLVVTPDLGMIDRLTPRVEGLGYVAKGEHGIPQRRYFSRSEGERLKVHVHAYVSDDEQIGRHLRFRDYLRAHPETAKHYCLLKQTLALEHGDDAEAYQSGKADFIDGVDAEAARWASRREPGGR